MSGRRQCLSRGVILIGRISIGNMTEPSNEEHQRETLESEDGVETNWDEVVTSFDDMDLNEELLRGIYAYGFEKPSAIQQRAVKPILTGRDVIAQAQSGKWCINVH